MSVRELSGRYVCHNLPAVNCVNSARVPLCTCIGDASFIEHIVSVSSARYVCQFPDTSQCCSLFFLTLSLSLSLSPLCLSLSLTHFLSIPLSIPFSPLSHTLLSLSLSLSLDIFKCMCPRRHTTAYVHALLVRLSDNAYL